MKKQLIYYCNHFLYKVGILKRYQYKQQIEEVLPCNVIEKELVTAFIKGVVTMDLVSYRNTNIDYFYINRKNGQKYITLYLSNKDSCELYAKSGLKDIYISIHKVWYSIYKNFGYTFLFSSCIFNNEFDYMENNKKVFDLKQLENIQCKTYIGTFHAKDISITTGLQENSYECNFSYIKDYLETLKFNDFIGD